MAELAFEDFQGGQVYELGTVRIDEDEMLAFARRFDPQPMHLDPQAAARNPVLRRLCASGWFTASLWMRAWADGVLIRATALGSPGGSALSWPKPVFPGDVLTARAGILGARPSRSRPGVGIVDILATLHRGAAEDADCVYRAEFTAFFGTRAAAQD